MEYTNMLDKSGQKQGIMDNDWEKFIELISNPISHGSHKARFDMPQNSKLHNRYSMLISEYPWVILLITPLIVVGAFLIAFFIFDLPDFSDPTEGFESRGTEISNRINTWYNMIDATGSNELLSLIPRPDQNLNLTMNVPRDEEFYSADNYNNTEKINNFSSYSSSETDEVDSGWICQSLAQCLSYIHPGEDKSRLVFAPTTKVQNLFTATALHSMCELENTKIRSHSLFNYYSEPSWSLGNYIAAINNKTSCLQVTDEDVNNVLTILKSCRGFYYNRTLLPTCWKMDGYSNCLIPDMCTKYNGVYNVLHYMTDVDFLSSEQPENGQLKAAITFLPVSAGSHMKTLYEDRLSGSKVISDGITQITAVYFDIKWDLFQDYLKSDAILAVIISFVIVLFMWIYTSSLFITLMTLLSIVFALLLAYYIYTVVFQISFFPFMNFCVVILLLGIGADDAFVFCDIWRQTKHDRGQEERQAIVAESLKHGGLTMFVTSFTTAAACYSNIVSPITAVGCFSIYAGTSVLCNFILTVTWLPAVISFHDKYFLHLCCHERKKYTKYFNKFQFFFSEPSRIFFDKLLPCIVIKLRFLWVVLLTGLAIGAFVVVYFVPQLRFPTSNDFQVFTPSHLLERYTLEYKQQFRFEKSEYKMPIVVIFGVKATDNGDYLNPSDKGSLEFDSTFSISEPEAQQWLFDFCQDIKNQTFYKHSYCLFEEFRHFMSSPCSQDLCCGHTEFPYMAELFDECIKVYIHEISKRFYFDSWSTGLRFDIHNITKALLLQFNSIYSYSNAHKPMDQMWLVVNSWVEEKLRTAPKSLQSGWFVSHFDFYDVQEGLAGGTMIALILSVGIAFIVMLLTTRNLIVSIFAMVTILSAILVTVASLVLMGWELNILESITISVAVGLSIDFTVHYGVAYSVAPDQDRESRVVYSLSRMGSAIMMAGVTTFAAGVLMMPSTLLAYTQLGTFLMLVMSFSWLYSTFYFQSLCRILGPQGNCGKIPIPWRLCRLSNCISNSCCKREQALNAINSTSSCPLESHELQPLTTDNTLMESATVSQSKFTMVANDNNQAVLHGNGGSHLVQQFHCIQPNNLSFSEVFLQENTYVTRSVPASSKTSEPVLPNSSPDVPDIWIKRKGS